MNQPKTKFGLVDDVPGVRPFYVLRIGCFIYLFTAHGVSMGNAIIVRGASEATRKGGGDAR